MTHRRPIEQPPSPVLRAGSVRVSRRLKASPERVFDAWLDPEQATRFLFACRTGDAVGCEIDVRVGGTFRIVRRGDREAVEYCGEYLEIDRPHRLVFSLFVQRYAQRDDRVVVELASVDEETLLVLSHEHSLPSQTERIRIQGLWGTTLDELQASCRDSVARMTVPCFKAPVFACCDADLAW